MEGCFNASIKVARRKDWECTSVVHMERGEHVLIPITSCGKKFEGSRSVGSNIK
jgi:hypothetical protein